MNERLKTVLMWAVALMIVGSCGLSAIFWYQSQVTGFYGTLTAMQREYESIMGTADAVLATSYAQQTNTP